MPPDRRLGGVVIRRGEPGEAGAIANLYLRVRHENLGAIPAVAHPDADVREWFGRVLLHRDEIWVAELAGVLAGFVALRRPDWVDQLYVDGAAARRGIGGALLQLAVRELGAPVQLWTFKANLGARRFYERHGFVAVEETDGDNEEGAPDVRYLLAQECRSASPG